MTTESRAPDTAAETPIRAQMLIGGDAVDAADGQTFDLVNPATGLGIGTAPLGGLEDVDRAVDAATAAFERPQGADELGCRQARTHAREVRRAGRAEREELARTDDPQHRQGDQGRRRRRSSA